MPIVAEEYAVVIGVDTHAATYTLALVTAVTGALTEQAEFPNSTAGLDRARGWITNRIDGRAALVVIEGAGSYGARLAARVSAAGLPVAEPAAMPAADRRGVGKTDALDAGRIARSVLALDASRLRWPRAEGARVALRVLTVARDQMVPSELARSMPSLRSYAPSTSALWRVKRCCIANSRLSLRGVNARRAPPCHLQARSGPVDQAHRCPGW